MYLKNKNVSPPGGFFFYYEDPKTKEEVKVPSGSRQANGVAALTAQVRNAFSKAGIPVPAQLAKIVEHQICIRQANPKSVCFMGGLGDDIHHNLAKPVLRSIEMFAGRVKMNAVARTARRVGGCAGCGGTKTYKSGKNNLGRAGTLNKITGSK